MQTKIAKWGNSLGIRIPGEVVDRLALSEGESLAIDVVGKTIELSSSKKKIPRYDLRKLLKSMKSIRLTKEDKEWLNSPPVGHEII